MLRRSSLALFVIVTAVNAHAVVQPPVLKWAYGGCSGTPGSYSCNTGWYSSPAVADLDGDGQVEAIWGGYDLKVVNGATGALRATGANGSRIWPGVAVADLTGDGTLEVIVGRGSNQLTVYRASVSAGTMTLNALWTRNPFADGEVRTLAVSDLESDGQLEIVVGRASSGATRQVSVYDANGNVRAGFPARRDGEPGYGWGMYNENIAIGDLNNDGFKEIFAPTDTHYITVLDRNGNQLGTNAIYNNYNPQGPKVWSQVGVHVDQAADLRGYANCGTEHRPNFANSAPAIGDLDGDGSLELVVPGDVYNCGVGDPDGDLYHLPFILKLDRTRWTGSGFDWTVLPTAEPGSGPLSQDYAVIENNVQNAVLADLDGDGRREILFPSYDGRMHAFWLDKTEHGSWPVTVPVVGGAGDTFRFASEPVVADLDNDGQAEVIFASWPRKVAGLRGELLIYSSQGVLLQRLQLPVPATFGDSWNGALGAPSLVNLDGDADLELVLGTRSSGIVAYDLPGTAGARVLWATGRGGLRRTGRAISGSFSISDAAIGEGGTATFTVSLSNALEASASVAWATAPGTATAPDFTAGGATLSFAPGVTTRTFTVATAQDLLDEADEVFTVSLSTPSFATIADGSGVGTIMDDDPLPVLSVSSVQVTEGTGGGQNAGFVVTLSPVSGRSVQAQYATADWTALAASDYTATSGTLTFLAGETSQNVSVPIVTDALDEPLETFGLGLGFTTGATIGVGMGEGGIQDDDPTPTLSVSDVSGPEGQSGDTLQTLTVTLSGLSAQTVSVNYATTGQTATMGEDFILMAGALSWPAGTNAAKTVAVPVRGDKLFEPDETYALNLSGPVAASLADGQGVGTLQNDDATGLSIADLRLVEPKTGVRTVSFTVTLAPPNPSQTVTVDWATAADSATEGSDYLGAGGTLSFAPSVSTQTADVTVNTDLQLETVERFFVNLTNPTNASLAAGQAQGLIVDPQIGGDFDADGEPDILWRHWTSGRNVVWLMNGTVRDQGLFTTPNERLDAGWRIVGTADFNADRRSDILWRHASTGALDVWTMNGTTQVGTLPLTPASEPDANWGLVGTGDFDANGSPDLFWRNTATGALRVWLMNGVVRQSEALTTPPTLPDLGWSLVGVGDFSGDGRPDLLWRHQISGRNVIWMMNGLVRTTGVFTTPDAFSDLNWKMVGVGDFNGDTWPDALWRHALSGRNVIWMLQGAVKVSGTFTTPDQLTDANWRIVGPR